MSLRKAYAATLASVQEPDFMKGPRTPLESLEGTPEARALAVERCPKKASLPSSRLDNISH